MEKLTALAFDGTYVERQLQIKYAQRRFSEADRMLTEQQSTAGYSPLIAQVVVAKDDAVSANDFSSQKQLLADITNYQQQLEQRKNTLTSSTAPTPPTEAAAGIITQPTPVPNPKAVVTSATTTHAPAITSPTPTITASPAADIEEIESTQRELDKIAKELEKDLKKEDKKDSKEEQQSPGSDSDNQKSKSNGKKPAD